ncbi:MAG: GNAT family N-acetyltransferase [Prevotellaceae bacterium]|jgi:GNAT superfamily N-acetyltransferase|nr:GNAT family N-acetyltransferase [Prevotellaceae bacterium]
MMNKDTIKELLKRCFPGSDEYYDRYMERRGDVDSSVTTTHDGRLIADLQQTAYPMRCFGGTISTAYYHSACVAPEARRQGVMQRLMGEALQRSRNEGAALCTLIPADAGLYGYYERTMGFTAIFHSVRHRIELTPDGQADPAAYTLHRHAHSGKAVFHYLAEHLGRRRCCVLHTEEELAFVVDDILIDGGWLYTLSHGQSVVALAIGFTHPEQDALVLKEVMADSEEAQQVLLSRVGAEQQVTKAVVNTPTPDAAAPAFGMARIVHPLPLLRLYAAAHPEVERHLWVSDPVIFANNGYYDLADGECTCGDDPMPDEYYEELDIGELADRLFADERPFMSLMFD